jgi:hypothetical protein
MTKERQIEILKGRINQCKLEREKALHDMYILWTGMIKAYEDAIRIIEGKL